MSAISARPRTPTADPTILRGIPISQQRAKNLQGLRSTTPQLPCRLLTRSSVPKLSLSLIEEAPSWTGCEMLTTLPSHTGHSGARKRTLLVFPHGGQTSRVRDSWLAGATLSCQPTGSKRNRFTKKSAKSTEGRSWDFTLTPTPVSEYGAGSLPRTGEGVAELRGGYMGTVIVDRNR